MVYRAVGDRCAVCFEDLHLPISTEKCLTVLRGRGYSTTDVDLIALARERIGQAEYRRGARLSKAPTVFDCSSFVKWLYGQKGIWLPRRSIQQREFGIEVPRDELCAGDLVFVSGFIDYYINDPADGVGHVGIATGNRTVIHAANFKAGLIESSFEDFVGEIGESGFRGIRRLLPRDEKVYTLITPADREIEWSDDIRWVILQLL